MMHNSKPYNSNKKLFIIFIISTLLSLVILEITLRINNKIKTNYENKQQIAIDSPKYTHQPYLIWRAKPNQKKKSFSINNIGFRGENFSENKEENVYRIILLGGSAAWGYKASSNENTISYLLEKELNKLTNNKRVEVLNFAENGYSSSQELILWNEISNYNPDLVISYTGYNDIYIGLLSLPPGWNRQFIKEEILTEDDNEILKKMVIIKFNKLLENFRIFQSIRFRTSKIFKINTLKNEETSHNSVNKISNYSDIKKISDIFVKNMKFSIAIAETINTEFMIIVQPSLFTKYKQLSSNEKKLLNAFEERFPSSLQYFRQGYNQLKSDLNKEDIEFTDGNNFFYNHSNDTYLDTVHYTDIGNQIIAENIANKIINKIKN